MMLLKAETSGIKLAATVDPDLPDVVADKRACRQIYLNLMSNALKFTATGGCVIVGARREKHGVALFVADTGVGIASDDLPRLGEAFFQASSAYDRAYEGTGPRPSVSSRGWPSCMAARWRSESTVGKGTTVTRLRCRSTARLQPRPSRPVRRSSACRLVPRRPEAADSGPGDRSSSGGRRRA